MSHTKREIQIRRWFGLFVCVGWIHLVFAVYPIPFQLQSEIRVMAEQVVDVERSLIAKGVSKESLFDGTKEDWVDGLTLNFWVSWVKNIVFLLAGLFGAVMAYQGRKNWQWVVGLASSVLLISMCFPWLKTENFLHTMSFMFIALFKSGINFRGLSFAYTLFVQPIFHFAILVGTLLLWRHQTSKLQSP